MLLVPILITALAQASAGPTADSARPLPPVYIAPAPPPPPPPPTPYPPRLAEPKGNIAGWIKNSDYPKQLRNGESGVVRFRLRIDAKGKPIGCDILASSGHMYLDAWTCELLMKRARFHPARDGYGKPVTGSYTSRVRWVTPVRPAPKAD